MLVIFRLSIIFMNHPKRKIFKDKIQIMKKIFLLLCAAAALVLAAPVSAQDGRIVIDRTAGKKANPTLVFKGVTGNDALSNRILRNLQFCGWFDVRNGGTSDYILSGTVSGNGVILTLSNGANRKIADFGASGTSVDKIAATAVDEVLKHEFGIPGICRSKIVFSAEVSPGVRDIYMCDFDGQNVTRITKNKTLSVEPVWTPDGKSIIYCFYGSTFTSLIQYRFDIDKSRQLTKYRGLNAGGSLSPDGKYAALVLSRENRVDLYMRPVEGGQLVKLTNDVAVEASPVWTPDGKKICFVSDVAGRPQLYMVDPFRHSAPVRIGGLRGSERVTPDFAENGTLAYSAKVGGDYVVTVAEMQSDSSANVIKVGLDNAPDIPGEGPSWAPDNRHVVAAFKGALYVIDTRLGTKRRLLNGSRTFQPDWSPILP